MGIQRVVDEAPWRVTAFIVAPALALIAFLDASGRNLNPYFNSWAFLIALVRENSDRFIYGQACLRRTAFVAGAALMLVQATAISRLLVEIILVLTRPRPLSYVREKLPVWSSLRGLGNSRLLRSSYLWIVAIPIVAKIFNAVDSAEIKVAGRVLNLALPFSWKIFFYSAVAASAATAMYSLFCPSIVKRFDSPDEFKTSGRGIDQLRREFVVLLARWYRRAKPDEVVNNVREFHAEYCEEALSERELSAIRATPWKAVPTTSQAQIRDDRFSDAFWFIRQEFGDRLHPFARGFCGFFYLVAFVLVGWLLLSNIAFVVKFHVCPELLLALKR